MDHAVLISRFFEAFAATDAEKMAACYHPDVQFHDPAFGTLKGEHAGNMWRMLCQSQRGQNFTVTFKNIQADGIVGRADWEAHYTFSKTNRSVHNRIHAAFEFKDGLIFKHRDHFNLHHWAHQALGFSGLLIGWTPFFRNKLQKQTNKLLRQFESKAAGAKQAADGR